MQNAKPRLALAIGIVCISIFPILVKLELTPGLISAFYRMAFAFAFLLPFAIFSGKLKMPPTKYLLLALLCGVLFGSDVAVWNIAIQESSATQASLLTNLSPVWVGIASFLFLRPKPKTNFWIGTVVAVFGMVTFVGFQFFTAMDFDRAFIFAVLSGIFYAAYLLISKNTLEKVDVFSFMFLSLFASSIYLAVLCLWANEPFTGFSNAGWGVLILQAAVCQLAAWFLISFATKYMRATRVSLSLLGQAVLTSIIAFLFLDELITLQMVIGGIILLFGIRITFIEKRLALNNIFKS
ncbi:DMT family transporter [Flavobacterium tegetincola]|uniref:DMT family transporter n=1 Tax=Flavobacterium tegetincola TaxID=150172 RepID=UPI0003F8E509|nr:DMT family transporter [Flavobacterium tegetincola]